MPKSESMPRSNNLRAVGLQHARVKHWCHILPPVTAFLVGSYHAVAAPRLLCPDADNRVLGVQAQHVSHVPGAGLDLHPVRAHPVNRVRQDERLALFLAPVVGVILQHQVEQHHRCG